MNIRTATRADHAVIAEVVMAAFVTHPVAVRDMVARLRASPEAFIPDLELVAVEADRVVGHVAIHKMKLASPEGEIFDVLNLTPLAVAPGHEHQGIGAALVEAAIARAMLRAEPLLFLEGRIGPTSLYSRYFEAHAPEITAPPEVPHHEGFQMRRLRSYDPKRHVGQAIYSEAVRALSLPEPLPSGDSPIE